MKLDQWCVLSRNLPALLAPEQERRCLHGRVSGHPRCCDGKEVTTSLLIGRHGNKVVTKSGSEYELGEADAAYEALYPQAKQRLLDALRPALVAAEVYEI
jgi:hypothetical protein